MDGRAAAASRIHPTSQQTGVESAREIGIAVRQTNLLNSNQGACRAGEGPAAVGAEAFGSAPVATMHSVVLIVPSVSALPSSEYGTCMGSGNREIRWEFRDQRQTRLKPE